MIGQGFRDYGSPGEVSPLSLAIRIRSRKLAELVEEALSQGFRQKVTGSGHLGIVCPHCQELTIFSGTQKDCTKYKYLNQETRLRNHGLVVPGKKPKECRYGNRR